MTYISAFNQTTCSITRLSKTISILKIDEKYSGVTIKILGDAAGMYGQFTKVDMSSTKIEKIEDNVFSHCSKLEEILFPDSLRSIGSNAFCEAGLLSVKIPSGVHSMGSSAWNQIPNIASFTVNSSNQHFSSQNGYLFNKYKTTLLRAPVSVQKETDIPNFANIRSIGGFAFTTTNMKSFTCTSKLSSLDYYSFHAMHKVETIDLSRGTFKIIPWYCFCLTDASVVLLPKTVTEIQPGSFEHMPNLKSLVCYKKIKTIKSNSFNNCSQLSFIFYAGKTDFSTAGCIKTPMNVSIYVSPTYKGDTFCGFAFRKMMLYEGRVTCNCQRAMMRRKYILSLILIVTC